jgi:hypothetical protein
MEKMQEFYQKAALLGHDAVQLSTGEEITSYLTVASLAEGRPLLSVATAEQRVSRQVNFFHAAVASRQRLGQGKHDRGEAVLFADGAFPENDQEGLGHHMPAKVKAISVLKKVLSENEVWDVSVRGAQWGIDDMEELYVTVNVGELIISEGARILIQGNVFSLLCQRLVCLPQKKTGDYHIGILPTPFSVDMRPGPFNGVQGNDGLDGLSGKHGLAPRISSSVIGYMALEPVDTVAMHGESGTAATEGSAGGHGHNGGMCKIAELTIRELEGDLILFTKAGDGGGGGHGGNGGNGGDGGNGAAGCRLIDQPLPDGRGGNGGNGGNGGRGGNGGSGGIASNIYVDLGQDQTDCLHVIAQPSMGGNAGCGGRAGQGGTAGRSGADTDLCGRPGIDGQPGKDGTVGRSRPPAVVFLNSDPVNLATEAPVTA